MPRSQRSICWYSSQRSKCRRKEKQVSCYSQPTAQTTTKVCSMPYNPMLLRSSCLIPLQPPVSKSFRFVLSVSQWGCQAMLIFLCQYWPLMSTTMSHLTQNRLETSMLLTACQNWLTVIVLLTRRCLIHKSRLVLLSLVI